MPAERTPIRAVLFDLDDTLNDRSASWWAFVEFLAGPGGHLHDGDLPAAYGRILAADQGGYRPKEQLFADLSDQLPWKSAMTADSVEALWRAEFPKCAVVRDGVVPVLERLKGRGVRLAVVTNGRTDAQRAKVDHMGIGSYLDAVVTSQAAGVKKPGGGIFRSALDGLDALASETLFVGDSPRLDVVGAAAVGMRTMWLANGRDWPTEHAPPTFRIGTFSAFWQVFVAAAPGQV